MSILAWIIFLLVTIVSMRLLFGAAENIVVGLWCDRQQLPTLPEMVYEDFSPFKPSEKSGYRRFAVNAASDEEAIRVKDIPAFGKPFSDAHSDIVCVMVDCARVNNKGDWIVTAHYLRKPENIEPIGVA